MITVHLCSNHSQLKLILTYFQILEEYLLNFEDKFPLKEYAVVILKLKEKYINFVLNNNYRQIKGTYVHIIAWTLLAMHSDEPALTAQATGVHYMFVNMHATYIVL